MPNRNWVPATLLAACLCSPPATAIPLVQEMALHSMLEATTSVFTTLHDYAVQNPDGISDGSGIIPLAQPIQWSGRFDNAGWSYDASGFYSGMALSMHYAGVITGSNGNDVLVTITGSGMLGNRPLTMGGFSTWFFDSTAQDYLDMDFDQGTQIGSNTRYGRVKGREKVICMLDGQVVGDGSVPRVVAGAPVELMSVASSGKKSRYSTANQYGSGTKECHLAPVQLTSIASSGKRGLATVSLVVVSLLSSTRMPAIAAPPAVAPGHWFDPSNQGTIVAMDGSLYADDARNQFRSSGQYLADGTFSGTVSYVSEPATLWLVGAPLWLLVALRGRDRRVQRLRSRGTG